MAEESVNTSVISGVTNNIYKVPDSVAIESARSDLKLLWCCIFFCFQFCLINFFLIIIKAELQQLNRTQFSSLGIFISKKVGNRKN